MEIVPRGTGLMFHLFLYSGYGNKTYNSGKFKFLQLIMLKVETRLITLENEI